MRQHQNKPIALLSTLALLCIGGFYAHAQSANGRLQAYVPGPSVNFLIHPSFVSGTRQAGDGEQPGSANSYPRLTVQLGHSSGIEAATFSPDGRLLLTGSWDSTARLWEVDTGRELRSFAGHSDRITSVAYSPDGRFVLTGSNDKTARLWDVTSGKELLRFEGHSAFIRGVAFSPDGRYVITGSGDGTARLWESDTGREVRRFRTTPASALSTTCFVLTVAFSPDGRYIVTAGWNSQARLWEIATGREVRRYVEHSTPLTDDTPYTLSASFSPDGRFLLTGDHDKTARLWDVKSGLEVRRFQGHSAEVVAAAFSPDGRYVLTGSGDKAARLWDVKTGLELRRFEGPSDRVYTVAFSPNGRYVLTVSWDSTARLWELRTGREVRSYSGRSVYPTSVGYSDDDKFIVAAGHDNTVRVWLVKSGKQQYVLKGHKDVVLSTAFSPDGKYLLTGSWDGTARIWELESGREIRRFVAHTETINSRPVPIGTMYAFQLARDATERRVDLRGVSPEQGRSLSFPVLAVAYSPDGRFVLAGNWDHTATLWDAAGGWELRRFEGHTDMVESVAFAPDGRRLLTGSADGSARLWELATGRELSRFVGHQAPVTAVSMSPDGHYVLTGSADNTARLWDAETGRELRRFTGHSEKLSEAVFSPDGRYVLTGSWDRTARLWDVATGRELRRFVGHSDIVGTAAFSHDGRFVITGSPDSTTRIWDSATGQQLCSLFSFRNDDWSAVAPDGRFDSSNLEDIKGLHWVMPDDPLHTLPLEVFMRDYYEPRLLSRILKGEKLPAPPALTELNRNQPKVGKITVSPEAARSELVDVRVEVASVAGQCVRGGTHVPCESGVYDLRLYRDGQLVGQSPARTVAAQSGLAGSDWQEQMPQWRVNSMVKTKDGNPITVATGGQEVVFTGVRLPQRADLKQVEFTAYAFNEDRVKSPTSETAVYTLPPSRAGTRRRAYIITVGVDATSDPSLRLGFAPEGAREVEALLRENLTPQYEVVSVPLISEYRKGDVAVKQDFATKGNIRGVLNILSGENRPAAQGQAFPGQEKLQPATPDDLVVLYIASHGYTDPGRRFYIVPSDVGEPAGVSETLLDRCLKDSARSESCKAAQDFLQRTISSDELTRWLQGIDAGQIVLILDSCHSAAVSGPNFKPGPMGDRSFGQLSYDKRMLVLAATQAENVDWGTLELGDRSLLTDALIHQGPWDKKDPFDLKEWLIQAERRVPELYRKYVPPGAKLEQEPELFDFARRDKDVNDN